MGFPNMKSSSTDIRWIWSNDPKIIGTGVVDTNEVRLLASGATLHSGIRIKNTHTSNTLYVGYTGGTDYMTTSFVGVCGGAVVAGGSGGYALGQDEELFLEMRNAMHCTVKGSAVSTTFTFLAH